MKRVLSLALMLVFLIACHTAAAEVPTGSKKALTLMIYMCGSNLESKYGSASLDIDEMTFSGVNTRQVNVLVMTGGSRAWTNGQKADSTQISCFKASQMISVRQQDAVNMGDKGTLTDFIDWSVGNYPAERYALILWDHGAGPLEGICLDELNAPDRLTLNELAQGLEEARLPGKLSWIGFDACLMATAEVAKAMSPYAQYMVASQGTEPARGWDYGFLAGIEADEDGAATGKRIVDGYFASQGEDAVGLTLSCLDLSQIDAVSEAMDSFFEPIGRSMDKSLFAELSALRTQSASFGKVVRGLTEDGYDLVDLWDLASHYRAYGDIYRLEASLENVVTYKLPADRSACGLSVYHPLRNKAGYQRGWKQLYSQMGVSPGYQKYLNSFGTILTGRELADWSQISLSDDGFGAAGENQYSLQLTPLQQENFSSAQLIILGAVQSGSDGADVYGAQLSRAGAPTESEQYYYPVLIDDVTPDEGGRLSAGYTGRSLYLIDENGTAVAGPIGYQRSDDGEYWYVKAVYYDQSGREDAVDDARVLYTCVLDEAANALNVVNIEVYDSLTETYTRRIAFDEADYTEMYVDRLAHAMPEGEGALPAFADWDGKNSTIEIALPLKWQLRFFDEQMSGTQLFATLQITDVQQNSYCTPPVPVENPNLYDIDILPRKSEGNGFELTLYAVQDSSPLNPGLNIGVSFTNTSHQALFCGIDDIILNGHREDAGTLFLYIGDVEPGQTKYASDHLDRTMLAGLGELTELSFELSTGLAGSSSSDRISSRYSVRLSGCDASITGGETVVPLDEVVRGDETWQLLDLRRNARGGLSGTLRVINGGENVIYGMNYFVVNDALQTDAWLYFSVDPHMDICVPFEIENSVYGNDLTLKGPKGNRYRYMGIDHLMERFGITEVTSLKLCRNSHDTSEAESVAFEWSEPIPIADPGEPDRWKPLGEGAGPLLDGAFTVVADRLLAADNGVALRLLITNHSDRDLIFEIRYPTLNGQTADLKGYYSGYAVGAGATLMANVSVEKDGVEAVEALGMCFRYGDYTTHSAEIVPDEPVPLDAEGGTYLSGSEVRVVPVDNARPGDGVGKTAPESVDIAGVALRMTAELTNDEKVDRLEDVDGSAKVRITVWAENQSDDALKLDFSNFVINGTRCVSGGKYISSLPPGGTGDCSLSIPALELSNLDRISAVECDVTVERNGDYNNKRKYPARFEVSGLPLAGEVPEPGEALCESKADGITLRLMSLREGADGALEGLLYLRNDAGAPMEYKYARPIVNGVMGGTVDIALPDGLERYIGFTFDNRLSLGYWSSDFGGKTVPDMSHLLQRMGMDAVYSFDLLPDKDGDPFMGGAAARLQALLPLSPWDEADMAEPKPLLEGGAFVGATHAAMTGEGLFLTLVLRNDSTERLNLDIVASDGDGCAMEVYYANKAFSLAPGVTLVKNVQLLTDKYLAKGERMEQVSLSFSVNGELAEGATLFLGEPMTVGQAELQSCDALDTIPASARRPMPAVLESVAAPGTQSVYTAVLVAPVDEQAVERFTYGYASVCVRDEGYVKDETGELVKAPCLRELCRIPLARDGAGLVAPYSGMALWDGYHLLSTREAPLDGGGTELRAEMVLYSPGRPYDYKLNEPLTERGYGVRMEGRWTTNETGSGPAIREGEWTLRNLETGVEDLRGIPLAEDGWKAYSEQTRYYAGGLPDDRNVDSISQRRLMFIPVQILDVELVLRYEIFYAGGESEAVTVDNGLAAILEAAETGKEQPGCLGELEPDGGGSIAVIPDSYESDSFRVSVSARLKLEDTDDASRGDSERRRIRLGLCMKVENRTGANVDAISSPIILNDAHETETKWVALNIRSESASVDTWYIEPEDLRAAGSVHRIRCMLNLCRTDNHEEVIESIPIDVSMEETDEAALWKRYGEVGETGVYGVTWQLLSAEMDRYGRVSGRLKAINHANTAWDLSNNAVLANGYRSTSVLSDFRLEAQSSSTVYFSFENFAWADCHGGGLTGEEAREEAQTLFILQSHGVREVTELTFALGIGYDVHRGFSAPCVTLSFELPEPLSLPRVDYMPGDLKPLMPEDGLSVKLESVLLGDETLSLALEIRNDTDEFYTVDLDHINLDGQQVYSWYWKEYSHSTVLPRTTQNCCMTLEILELETLLAGDGIENLHFCFWVTDETSEYILYRAAHVWPDVPLRQAGDLIRADGCEVRPATFAREHVSGLADELCLPPVAGVRPRVLTPQISEEKAALFESGEASICVRNDYDEYDAPDLPCEKLSKEMVVVALERDASGTVSAQYSGLLLTLSGGPFPMHERRDGGEMEISSTIYLFKDYYDVHEIRDPGTDGGSPDVVSVGEPSFSEDQDVPAPAVKAELCYRVGREGGELIPLGEEVSFIDMQTGEAVNGDVADWMYHSTVIVNAFCDDDYENVNSICCDFGGDVSYYPSLLPVERFIGNEYYWSEADLVVRYHIRYSDGSEEILVEPY